MNMRLILPLAAMLLACCRSSELSATHPAVLAKSERNDDLQLSFFADFDDHSFRALAERAFTDEDTETRERAAQLLDSVVWNWHPGFPQQDAQRHRARLLLFPLTRHADARVRTGIWRLVRILYDDPSIAAPAADAFAEALIDSDPDVRLASLLSALALHSGHPGGCVVDRKKTSFSLRVQLDRLSTRLFLEPDPRVRAALLRSLTFCGRNSSLPLFARYFSEADRRDELPAVGWMVLELFKISATGLESELTRPRVDDAEAWTRFRAFTESLTASPAARRNGIALVLFVATETSTPVHEDRGLLRRVVEGLERDEEGVREEDLFRIVDHWRVMAPSDVVHRPHDFLRRSSVPEIVKSLRELLAAGP